MNVRMVNAVFEDANAQTRAKGFDPGANTTAFIEKIPDYAAHGVRAFTLNLQGGMPNYEGAINSAFNPDGSLRDGYLKRVRRVIEACDRHGVVVILGCYYQMQDQILKDEAAVRAGVTNAARWIRTNGFTNVVLEIANEYGHKGFEHNLLKTDEGQVELIRLAKKSAPYLLVSTSGLGSGLGNGRLPDAVATASDFLLPHFNTTLLDEVPPRIAALKRFGKPVVCNEDDKAGAQIVQPAGLWRTTYNAKTWVDAEGEDRFRRGLYTYLKRTTPYPSMTTFDGGSGEVCQIRRIRTNTPLQALVTLNDPVYLEAAAGLARRMIAEAGATASRAARGLRLALIRPLRKGETAPLVALQKDAQKTFEATPEKADALLKSTRATAPKGISKPEFAAWIVTASAILNLDEFLSRS